tara:strand:+ start:142 stop:357 length:216 start_codon:yes stop_codon:yes gene_type:complete
MATLEQALQETHKWARNRIIFLTEEGNHDQLEDAFAIEREFDEWLGEDSESDVLSLEYIEDFHEGDSIIEI